MTVDWPLFQALLQAKMCQKLYVFFFFQISPPLGANLQGKDVSKETLGLPKNEFDEDFNHKSFRIQSFSSQKNSTFIWGWCRRFNFHLLFNEKCAIFSICFSVATPILPIFEFAFEKVNINRKMKNSLVTVKMFG